MRIIPLQNHPIYSAGRKFAHYRWGVIPKSGKATEIEVCELKEESKNGISAPKASMLLVEKSDCKQPTKSPYPQKKFH